ncbi:GntR family transcriptional regulator [Microbacterium sp. 1P10UB]|uniref:GntR family transcriptional regulator n=1 Tax=unclassified Microbacterium TaxID=2609290 RepID=UPI0039A24684
MAAIADAALNTAETMPDTSATGENTPSETAVGETAIGETAADRIRAAIVRGDYAPNQRLIEADLSAAFDASRATVRTALLALTGEGLVERMPNKGSRVRAISLEEAIEILEVRMGVEGLCAAKAAEEVGEGEIAELLDLRADMLRAVADGDLPEYSRLNQLLDQRTREFARHATAAGVLARLHAQSVRHQFKLSGRPLRAKVSVQEHVAIIDAIVAKDPDAAEQAVRTHLRSVIAALRELP